MAQNIKSPSTPAHDPLWGVVDLPQLIQLTRAYYSGALKKSDNTPYTWPDKAIPMPHLVPQGKKLIMEITYDQMDLVIKYLRSLSENVGGMTVQGWHEYVIRVMLKLEKPWIQKNELMPRVKDYHQEESLEQLGLAFLNLIVRHRK